MKCKTKDCKDCVHFINIRTHPLWADFVIKDESGKSLVFEGCVFHLQTMFLRQLWVRTIGVEAAIESSRDDVSGSMLILAKGINEQVKQFSKKQRVIENGSPKLIGD